MTTKTDAETVPIALLMAVIMEAPGTIPPPMYAMVKPAKDGWSV
jgi:hypothetical protein